MARRTDPIADGLRRWQTRVFRVIQSMQIDRARALGGLQTELVDITRQYDPTVARSLTDKLRRIDAANTKAKLRIGSTYGAMADANTGDVTGIVQADMTTMSTLMTAESVDYSVQALASSRLRTIVTRALIGGAPQRDWWKRQAADTAARYVDALRQGIQAGESLSQLVDRVIGTGAVNFKDSVLATSLREAANLVRTSVLSAQHDVRMEEFKQNKDVIRGWAIVATFDTRTCPVCRALSGASFDLNGNPLPESHWRRRLPTDGLPLHWSCRCIAVPVLMDEKAPAEDYSYEVWLKQQDEETQREVLGAKWYDAWKSGRLKDLRHRIDQKGRPLRLDQLAA